MELVWLTPSVPNNPYGKVIINAPQKEIGDYYRNAEIFVSASEYEAFPLPPLEAFACGCPVVSSNNKGILEYAEDNRNCLLYEIGNIEEMVGKIENILNNLELKNKLVKNAMNTAKQFSWESTMENILSYFREIAKYKFIRKK